MSHARNTEALLRSAAQKHRDARERVRGVIDGLEQLGLSRSLRAIAQDAHVSRTFLYAPKNADLTQDIRRLQQRYPQPSPDPTPPPASPRAKSDTAKDAQIARLQERVRKLEEEVRTLRHENQHLYGKLASQ